MSISIPTVQTLQNITTNPTLMLLMFVFHNFAFRFFLHSTNVPLQSTVISRNWWYVAVFTRKLQDREEFLQHRTKRMQMHLCIMK